MKETKPFSYEELRAMCMISATHATLMLVFADQKQFKNETDGRRWLETEIDRIVYVSWNREDKK